MMASLPTFVVDEREKQPYEFKNSETKTLPTGDYSIVGLEDRVAIERKTLTDAFKSLGSDRGRFRREVERLSEMGYAAIVIEANLGDLLHQPAFSRVNPRVVVQALLSWSIKYGVHVFFAGDRSHGQALTRYLLERYWHYTQQRDGSPHPVGAPVVGAACHEAATSG